MEKERKEVVVLEEKGCITPGCNNMVVFTNIDEDYYREKGFLKPNGQVSRPSRCKPCRIRRKASGKTHAELNREEVEQAAQRRELSPFAGALKEVKEKEKSDAELFNV